MKEILKDLKEGNFKRFYLLYGEEDYLVKLYEEKLRATIIAPDMEMMNMDIFDGKAVGIGEIIDAANTLPFMSENRLVIIRESGLFAPGRKDDTDRFAEALPSFPDTTIVIFAERQIDKRSKLYKRVNDGGRAVDFVTPPEKELAAWVTRLLKQNGKTISAEAIGVLLQTLERDMNVIASECEKLIAYKGDAPEILPEDIEKVCVKTLDTKVFDLVDAVCRGQAETALDIFANLLLMKESPIMVISLMARQFRFILQSKYLAEKGIRAYDISTRLAQRTYVIEKCLKQAENFTLESLKEALRDCLEADINIKSGKMKDRLAVELLIIKYSKGNLY